MVVSIPQSEYVCAAAAYTSVILKKVRNGRNNNKLLLNDIFHSGHRLICK